MRKVHIFTDEILARAHQLSMETNKSMDDIASELHVKSGSLRTQLVFYRTKNKLPTRPRGGFSSSREKEVFTTLSQELQTKTALTSPTPTAPLPPTMSLSTTPCLARNISQSCQKFTVNPDDLYCPNCQLMREKALSSLAD